MKFKCSLIVVSDVKASRNFYENLFGQVVKYDFGENVTFEGDFAIQEKLHFANMVVIDQSDIVNGSNSFELYFEEENIENFVNKLKKEKNIKLIHDLIEHPWGQRVIRFYDPDMHMIEVGENMSVVIRRFLKDGLSPEETAKRTQHPLEFVRTLI